MAATLTWIRSRLLLPVSASDAQAARREAEAVRRQVVDRAAMVAAADWLEHRPQLGRDVFARGRPEQSRESRRADVVGLLRACLTLLAVPADRDAIWRRRPPFWTVADALARVALLLEELPDGSALSAYLPLIAAEVQDRTLQCRAAVAGTFVAGLELARQGSLTAEQSGLWEPISLHRGAADAKATDRKR